MKTVIEELKQRMLTKSAEVRRYKQKIEQLKQNRIFYFDQKKMYAEFSEGRVKPNNIPNAEESKRLCGDIWNVREGHNREAEWLKYLKNKLGSDKQLQERTIISLGKVRKQCRKMPSWKP